MSIPSTTLRVYIHYRGEITIQRKDNDTLNIRESNDTTTDRHEEASFQSKSAYSLLDFEPSKFTQCTSPDTEPSAGEPSATCGYVWVVRRRTNEHLRDAAILR